MVRYYYEKSRKRFYPLYGGDNISLNKLGKKKFKVRGGKKLNNINRKSKNISLNRKKI